MRFMKLGTDSKQSAEFLDAIKGIQRGLDEMKAGNGVLAKVALEQIRRRHKIAKKPSRAGARRST